MVAIVSGAALSLAFPKANLAAGAPLAAAGLFWSWRVLSWKRAFWAGWLGGIAFFSLTFSWIGETAGPLAGPLAPLVALGPGVIEGLAFAVTGALVAIVARRASSALAPLAAAAAFAVTEALRSRGPLGVPFEQLGYTQVETPLAPLAAFVGAGGLTFTVCVLGAYLAWAIGGERRAYRTALIAWLVVGASAAAAWAFWPARSASERPTIPVAVVQGNIRQDVKWTEAAFALAVDRYTSLTQRLARDGDRPAFVLWPETVIPTSLNQAPALAQRFAALARSLHTTLIVGTNEFTGQTPYNTLWFFGPDGAPPRIYRKRRLVPFAETLPAAWLFDGLPATSLVSRFGIGTDDAPVRAGGLALAPLICWESGFAELVHANVARGAQALIVATDDAWFGESAGPYQHAQIAQMRALEAGAWVVRAAATGISGIVAPNGRYVEAAPLDRLAVVRGRIGRPPGSLFARFGPSPVIAALALLYLGIAVAGGGRLARGRRAGAQAAR